MAVLKILTDEDPVLRKRSKDITKITQRLRSLIKDMLETMYDAKGVGLAAPQVGILERLIIIDVGDGPIALINPRIVSREGKVKDVEGCLSLPGRNEYITRAEKVSVIGIDPSGKKVNMEGTDLLARAFQHEIDHLDGILFIDYLKKES